MLAILLLVFSTLSQASVDFPLGASAIISQSDRLVVAGGDQRRITALRLKADGTLDKSFAERGLAKFDPSANCDFLQSASAFSGGFVLAGSRGNTNGCPRPSAFFGGFVARFDADGKPDKNFGAGGFVSLGDGKATFDITAVVAVADGSVYFGGNQNTDAPSAYTSSFGRPFLGRLKPDGQLDPSFGKGGLVYSKLCEDLYPCRAALKSLALVDNGQALLASGFYPVGAERYFVEKYDLDGKPVFTFGKQGRALIGTTGRGAETMAVDESGAIYLAGNAGSRGIRVVKLDALGKLDERFGKGGIAEISSPHSAIHQPVRITARQGRVHALVQLYCVAPMTQCGPEKWGNAPSVARIDSATGKLDAVFGDGGFAIFTATRGSAGDFVLAADDSFYVAMGIRTFDFGVAKFTADGKLDTAYGGKGYVTQSP